MAKKPSETLDEKIVAVALEQCYNGRAVSHLRVKAILDSITGKVNCPAEIYRALANCSKLAYSYSDNLFRMQP